MNKWMRKVYELFTDGYDKQVFTKNKENIKQHNVNFLLFFNTLTLVILFLAFLSSFCTEYVLSVRWIFGMAVLFTLAEILFDRYKAGENSVFLSAGIYICMTKIYCMGILLGVFYNIDAPAVSFFPLMIVMSILFIVRPLHLQIYNFFVCIVFCLCTYAVKSENIASGDIYCCIIFYLLQIFVSFWIIKLRISHIRNEQLLILQRDTDVLTELPNRRYFSACVSHMFEENKDRGNLSILMMDIDHFKAYNDCKGHLAGDYCLTLVGRALKELGEKEGILFARYGGEEFVAVDDCHSSDEIEAFAERIVKQVYDLNLPHESTQFKRLTVSVGYATQEKVRARDYVELLKDADEALYKAKERGRNRIAGYNMA